MESRPVVPDYGGACVANLVPALLAHRDAGRGLDPRRGPRRPPGRGAGHRRARCSPTAPRVTRWLRRSRALTVGSIDSVAPTTTATALDVDHHRHRARRARGGRATRSASAVRSSTRCDGRASRATPATGSTRPSSSRSDPSPAPARRSSPRRSSPSPDSPRPTSARAPTARTGWRRRYPSMSTPALAEGNRFVYAYYDGIDKVAHICGFGPHYDAELAFVDRLVADIAAALPAGAALVVTADHGQVQVGESVIALGDQTLRADRSRVGRGPVRVAACEQWPCDGAPRGRSRRARRRRLGGAGRPGPRRGLVRSGRAPTTRRAASATSRW